MVYLLHRKKSSPSIQAHNRPLPPHALPNSLPSSQFPPEAEEPELTLGEARVPGSDNTHFCKPTSVAVASSGDFFVADGYCNARVLRFAPDGVLKDKFGHPGESCRVP